MKRIAGVFIGLAAAAVFSAGTASAQGLEFLHEQRAEGGRICFTDHFHYGSSSGEASRAAAERSAIASWAGFTALEYGNNWGSWRIAASKKMSCSQSGAGWGCNAEARPCKPAVGGRRSTNRG